MARERRLFDRLLDTYAKPLVKKTFFSTARPNDYTRWLYRAILDTQFAVRESYEWARRALVATPVFLSRCAVYGERIVVDRIPYIAGPTRIELGSDVRISGKCDIYGASKGTPVLKIGNGVFIANGCTFAIAERIEIGDLVSIGGGTHIADTEGHSHYNPKSAIWEVPAGEGDIAPVIIEDGVQIGRQCTILKGVRLGARSVIGARSVVRSSVPPDSIVMGNPARVVKRMNPDAPPLEPAPKRES